MSKLKHIVLEAEDNIEIKVYDHTNIELGNPFHDAIGRFTSKSISAFSFGGSNTLSRDLSSGGIILNFTNSERRIASSAASSIQSKMSSEISGINKVSVTLSGSSKEWANKFNISEEDSNMVFGVAKQKEIILSPVSSEILTGKTNGLSYMGNEVMSKEQAEEMINHVIIHETLHKRDRKYLMEYRDEPGMEKGLFIDPKKYDMRKEEGATEFLAQVTAVKLGVSTKESIMTKHDYGQLAYPKDVRAMIGEARARHPDSPEKAIEFINNAHKTGFTMKGIEETFGNKWARNGWTRTGDGILDSVTFNDAFHWQGRGRSDRKWIMEADFNKLNLDIFDSNIIILTIKKWII